MMTTRTPYRLGMTKADRLHIANHRIREFVDQADALRRAGDLHGACVQLYRALHVVGEEMPRRTQADRELRMREAQALRAYAARCGLKLD